MAVAAIFLINISELAAQRARQPLPPKPLKAAPAAKSLSDTTSFLAPKDFMADVIQALVSEKTGPVEDAVRKHTQDKTVASAARPLEKAIEESLEAFIQNMWGNHPVTKAEQALWRDLGLAPYQGLSTKDIVQAILLGLVRGLYDRAIAHESGII